MTTLPEEAVKAMPCPRCASQNVYIEPDERGSGGQWVFPVHIGCTDCGINLICNEAETVEDAISHWNERAPFLSVQGASANACPCTKIQQDETCPVGYPSLLCEICDGRGVAQPSAPDMGKPITDKTVKMVLAEAIDQVWYQTRDCDVEEIDRIIAHMNRNGLLIVGSQRFKMMADAIQSASAYLALSQPNSAETLIADLDAALNGETVRANQLSGISGQLEPSAARELALEALRSAEQFIENGFEFGFIRKPDEGDPALETLPKIKAAIRALSSPDHADAVRERAWYFSAGDTVPEWLEKIEKGNCTLTFGVDVVVTSKDGGYEVRPQGIADNAGPILHVVNQGNVTPEIKGGGNGVAIIGYNRPYDETAEGKIERLKRLLEMARPYVECYNTREHNAEQDAVLTEIDKALSVVVGETHADAGKVEGDGWLPIESAPKDGTEIWGWHKVAGPSQTRFYDGEWCCVDWNEDQYIACTWEPTHWRPIPSAPSEGTE